MTRAMLAAVASARPSLRTAFTGTSAPSLASWCGLAIAAIGACGDASTTATSSLAERSRVDATDQTAQNSATPASPASATPEADPQIDGAARVDPPTTSTDTPPAGSPGPRVALALRLDPAVEYRVTTVGMVQLPVVDKPTGFALQESVTLDDCEAEGAARHCRARHRFVNFDAEPPAGKFMQNDHDRVAAAVLTHTLSADGSAQGPTEVEGELDREVSEALALAHGFQCIRLPPGPVAVGDKWKDTCRQWARGALATRDVEWELAKIDDDPQSGKRAELQYHGSYSQPSRDGERVGTVQGVLYFFVDVGEPHLIREQVTLPLKAGGATTKTTLNVQFAHVDPKDPEKVVRTDGQPFPDAPPPVQPPTPVEEAH